MQGNPPLILDLPGYQIGDRLGKPQNGMTSRLHKCHIPYRIFVLICDTNLHNEIVSRQVSTGVPMLYPFL